MSELQTSITRDWHANEISWPQLEPRLWRWLLRNSLKALLLAASCTTIAAASDETNSGELTIHATGFKNTQGHAIAKLFAPGDNVLRRGHSESEVTIDAGTALFHFTALSPGRYAVVVFHDKNNNGVIDHGLLGPSEPLGFSGNFVLSLISCRPTFEQLGFTLAMPAQTLEIQVR